MRGIGDQGARDRAALFLAAGKLVRIAAGHVGEFEAIQLLGDAPVPFEARQAVRGEGQIFAQSHVREQRVVLENIAAGALLRRQIDARSGIEEDAVVEQNAAGIGRDETGDGIERERLARAAGSIERGHAGRGFEFDVEVKAGRFGSGREIVLSDSCRGSSALRGAVPDDWRERRWPP